MEALQGFFGAALNKLSQAWPFGCITAMGRARIIVSLFLFVVFTCQDWIAHNSRLDFSCNPEISTFHIEQCFSSYSSEVFPIMRPYEFLCLTACVQVVLWIAMIQYGSTQLQKLTKQKITRVIENEIWRKLWTWSCRHVVFEVGFVTSMLVLFIVTQEFDVPDKYSCTFDSALVATCIDQWHRKKRQLKWLLIIVMAFMWIFCVLTLWQMSSEQKFKNELLLSSTPASNKGKERLEMLIPYH